MAVVEKIHSIFSNIWTEEGFGFDDFLNWAETELIQSMQRTHIEMDHAENHTRRYCDYLL